MGNTKSAHTIDELTTYLHKTPFFVYFDANELRDFAKCFTAKKILKGSTINQTGSMYIVAQGEVAMTTMLEDEVSPIPAVSDKVVLHAGDASSGRSLKRDVGGESPTSVLSKKKNGKPKQAKSERSIKVSHKAGQVISTGNLQASGIVSPQEAERTRKRLKNNRGSPNSPGDSGSVAKRKKSTSITAGVREALSKQASVKRVNGTSSPNRSPTRTPQRSPHGSMENIPPAGSSDDSFANSGGSKASKQSLSREGTLDGDENFDHSDELHDSFGPEQGHNPVGRLDSGIMKKVTSRFSFSAALGRGVRKMSITKMQSGGCGEHALEGQEDDPAGDSTRSRSNRNSSGRHGFGLNIFNKKHENNRDAQTSAKWSFASKLSGRHTQTGDKFRGVMKLEAVEDSVLLFLDKGRQRKFLKKHPQLKDIVDVLMHAKIDNFLGRLPFIKASVCQEGNEGGEHEGLGMLSSVCKYEAFNEGEPIFCEGEYGDKLYIILKGSCAVLTAASEASKSAETKAQEFAARENDAGGLHSKVNKENDTTTTTNDAGNGEGAKEEQNRDANPLPGAVGEEAKPRAPESERRNLMQKKNSGSKRGGRRERSIQEKTASKRRNNSSGTIRNEGKNLLESMKKRFRKGETRNLVITYQEDDVLATLNGGDYFGEMAVMVSMPRSSTVVAAEKCLVLTVSKDNWQEFLSHHEHTRLAVEAHMKSRLMGMFSKMSIPFFEKVADDKFLELSQGCEVLDLPEGHVIMKQGDRGDQFYVIINGTVQVDVKANGPKKDWKGVLCTGQYFGEIALVLDSPRKATVTTLENTVLLVINSRTFKLFFEDNPRALAEVQIRLLGERAELHSILTIPASLQQFQDFLDAEHSRENIDFWIECRNFEASYDAKNDTMEKRLEYEASRTISEMEVISNLWELYVKENAEMQVNISSSMRNVLQKAINALKRWIAGEDIIMDGTMTRSEFEQLLDSVRKRHIFVDAKQEIYKLMVRDSYPRFQKNDKYKSFVKELGLYSTANAEILTNKMAMLKDKTNQKEKGRGRNSLGPLGAGKKKPGMGGGGSMFKLKLADRMSSVKSVLEKKKKT